MCCLPSREVCGPRLSASCAFHETCHILTSAALRVTGRRDTIGIPHPTAESRVLCWYVYTSSHLRSTWGLSAPLCRPIAVIYAHSVSEWRSHVPCDLGDRLMGLIVYRMHLVPPDRSDPSDNPCVSDQDTSYSPPTSCVRIVTYPGGGGRLLPIATTRRETYGSLMALVTSACKSFTLMVRGEIASTMPCPCVGW